MSPAADTPAWSRLVRWNEIARGGASLQLDADEVTRARIARALDLPAIERLRANVSVRAWLDGAEVHGHIDAGVTQICGVTLDPFSASVVDDFVVRVVPFGSPNATPEEGEEAELDPLGEDPPDVVAAEGVDVAAYVVEHLALALDPFPRKPGVAFEPPPGGEPESPFAVLKALKTPPAND